jgi:hypothetical protein
VVMTRPSGCNWLQDPRTAKPKAKKAARDTRHTHRGSRAKLLDLLKTTRPPLT